MILVLLLINYIIVELVDRQNIPNQIGSWLVSKITRNKFSNVFVNKPFSCSYCLTFWLSLIYMAFEIDYTILSICSVIAFALINATLTRSTYYILGLIDSINEKIFKLLYEKIK